jgi:hypothetical protein
MKCHVFPETRFIEKVSPDELPEASDRSRSAH